MIEPESLVKIVEDRFEHKLCHREKSTSLYASRPYPNGDETGAAAEDPIGDRLSDVSFPEYDDGHIGSDFLG